MTQNLRPVILPIVPVVPIRTATDWSEQGRLVRFNSGLEDTASLKADLADALPLLEPVPENCGRFSDKDRLKINGIEHFR